MRRRVPLEHELERSNAMVHDAAMRAVLDEVGEEEGRRHRQELPPRRRAHRRCAVDDDAERRDRREQKVRDARVARRDVLVAKLAAKRRHLLRNHAAASARFLNPPNQRNKKYSATMPATFMAASTPRRPRGPKPLSK